jgi:hypothetical protein
MPTAGLNHIRLHYELGGPADTSIGRAAPSVKCLHQRGSETPFPVISLFPGRDFLGAAFLAEAVWRGESHQQFEL